MLLQIRNDLFINPEKAVKVELEPLDHGRQYQLRWTLQGVAGSVVGPQFDSHAEAHEWLNDHGL